MTADTPTTADSALKPPGNGGLRMRIGTGPGAAAEARSALAKLRADLDPPLLETLRLLVTELITNSVRHTASDAVTLRVAVGRATVLTEVSDEGPSFDLHHFDDAKSQDTGWGLLLVQRLADNWGVKQGGRTKRVWFELRRA